MWHAEGRHEVSRTVLRCSRQIKPRAKVLGRPFLRARHHRLPRDLHAAWTRTIEKHGLSKDSRCGYSIGLNYPPDWGERTLSLVNGETNPGESAYRVWPRTSVEALRKDPGRWVPATGLVPEKNAEGRRNSGVWKPGNTVFMIVHSDLDANTGRDMHRLRGRLADVDGTHVIAWTPHASSSEPRLDSQGLYNDFVGAALTGHAFDRVLPGLGMWLVTIACWLFALSTIISWAYYGEQGVVYLVGAKGVLVYKLVYCGLVLISTLGFIRTDSELDAWTSLGTGVMLFANIPIMWIFGLQAMKAYHRYIARLKGGEFTGHGYPKMKDVVEGKDVQ